MENDSTIYGLPVLEEPSLADLMVIWDTSASATKRVEIAYLMALILSGSAAFQVVDGMLKLTANMDANINRITNLAAGTSDSDAVRYDQVSAMISSLASITPSTPVAEDKGAFIRVLTSTIINPFGGFYLFYWCVDTTAGTTIDMVNGSPTASNGATVHFDGSVANVVNIAKSEGLNNKYFHCAVRYRNITSQSGLSSTGTALIELPSPSDLVLRYNPKEAKDLSASILENRLRVVGVPDPEEQFGVSYRLEMLYDDTIDTEIVGNEPGLVTMSSNVPIFSSELPITAGKYSYIHLRCVTRSLFGDEVYGETMHVAVAIDTDVFNDNYLNHIALKMSERMQTQDGTPLKQKE